MQLHCRRACVVGMADEQTGMNGWLSCAAARVKVGLRWSCCPLRQWAILVGGLSGESEGGLAVVLLSCAAVGHPGWGSQWGS